MNHEVSGSAADQLQAGAWQSQIDAITARSLTPENIASYADDAQSDLLGVTKEMIEAYHAWPEKMQAVGSGRLEQQAFWHFSMDPDRMQSLLDHFENVGRRLRQVDLAIAQAAVAQTVYVPPDVLGRTITPGAGTYERPRTIDRLKTTLFILQNSFDVAIDDPKQLRMSEGEVTDDMIRTLSYYAVEVIKLNRTILVCDEEGNAGYVFARDKLTERGITSGQLVNFGKSALNELLVAHPDIGRRLRYSKRFAERMHDSIVSPAVDTRERVGIPLRYLDPDQAQGLHSERDIAREIDMPYNTFRQKIGQLRSQIDGEPLLVSHGKGLPQKMWAVAQKEQIKELIAQANSAYARSQATPEGMKSLNQLKIELGGRRSVLLRDIAAISEELGPLEKHWFGTNFDIGLTEGQLATLKAYREARQVPESLATASGMADEFDADKDTVLRAIKTLGAELGEVALFPVRNRERETPHYDPRQKAMVKQLLAQQGEFLPPAPDDHASRRAMCSTHNISGEIFDKALAYLGDELGVVGQYKFGSKRVPGYSPEQQAQILAAVPLVRKRHRSKR